MELFVAQFTTLMERCVKESAPTPGEATAAFEMPFDLMRRIDERPDGIVYFTDESGSWQLHVHWSEVVPAHFSSLARTVTKDEYDSGVDALLRDFGGDIAVTRQEPRALAVETWAGESG